MEKRPLNLPFLGLQALLILIDCIAVAYVSPILVSFGYSPMRIGRVMTLAALAATLARPVWVCRRSARTATCITVWTPQLPVDPGKAVPAVIQQGVHQCPVRVSRCGGAARSQVLP